MLCKLFTLEDFVISWNKIFYVFLSVCYICMLHQCAVALTIMEIFWKRERVVVALWVLGIMASHKLTVPFKAPWCSHFDVLILVACLFTQVKIQKESEVRLKIIGTRVDATEIVSLLLSTLFTIKSNFECSFFSNLLSIDLQMATTSHVFLTRRQHCVNTHNILQSLF